jgi:hypothetical protein
LTPPAWRISGGAPPAHCGGGSLGTSSWLGDMDAQGPLLHDCVVIWGIAEACSGASHPFAPARGMERCGPSRAGSIKTTTTPPGGGHDSYEHAHRLAPDSLTQALGPSSEPHGRAGRNSVLNSLFVARWHHRAGSSRIELMQLCPSVPGVGALVGISAEAVRQVGGPVSGLNTGPGDGTASGSEGSSARKATHGGRCPAHDCSVVVRPRSLASQHAPALRGTDWHTLAMSLGGTGER